MAIVLRLENRAGGTTVDLFNDGDSIVTLSYEMFRAGGFLTHAFRIKVDAGTETLTRAAVQALEDILELAIDWRSDPLEFNSIWLREVTDSETAKRALVVGYEMRPVNIYAAHKLMPKNTAVFFDLAITTLGAWEDIYTTASSLDSTGSSISTTGGEWDLTGTISGGRVDARIPYFYVGNNLTQAYETVWIGIRPLRYGIAAFTGRIDCSSPNSSSTDTTESLTSVSDYTDSGHSNCDFSSDATLSRRLNVDVGDEDFAGRYLVLLRYKQTGGTTDSEYTARVGTAVGVNTGDDPMSLTPTQYLSQTVWTIAELGELQLPPYGVRDLSKDLNTQGMSSLEIVLEVGQISGDRDFVMDCLILIPSEHMVRWEGELPSSGINRAGIATYEDEQVVGYRVDGNVSPNAVDRLAGVSAQNWRYPHEGGLAVIAATPTAGTEHNGALTCSTGITVIERWLTYNDT